MISLEGKTAIITGAARGQGAATATLFAAAGARVFLTDVLVEEGEAVAAEIGDGASFRRLDVSSQQNWADLVSEVEQVAGKIDILVNNAALADSTPFLELAPERVDQMTAVNVKGCILGMQAVLPGMIERGGGSIINISSVNGLRGTGGTAAYDATKWAVRGMSKSVALEFADRGIRVNTVHPGAIDTPMLNPGGGDLSGLAKSFRVPMGRVGEPTEVAYASLFLASDSASYISGAELAVDGAWSAGLVLGRIADHR
jgi:3alpha(or 20beta)-hydroxysteroid dehydrogenase